MKLIKFNELISIWWKVVFNNILIYLDTWLKGGYFILHLLTTLFSEWVNIFIRI
jgi:hypothetical protein